MNDGQDVGRLSELQIAQIGSRVRACDFIRDRTTDNLSAIAHEADIQVAEFQDIGLLGRVLEWDQPSEVRAGLYLGDELRTRPVLDSPSGRTWKFRQVRRPV